MRGKDLITGGAGYVGSHLTTALLDRGNGLTRKDTIPDWHPKGLITPLQFTYFKVLR